MTKCASIEYKRRKVVCVAIHPGTVDTSLSVPWQKGVPEGKLFSIEQSSGYMLDVIDSLKIEDTGKFFAYDGSNI